MKTCLRKNPAAVVFLALAILITASVYGCRRFMRQFWEATLHGPFRGEAFANLVEPAPYSTLNLKQGVLTLHRFAGLEQPVLVCSSTSGDVLSQTLLIPSRTNANHTVDTATVFEMTLVRAYYPLRLTNAPICVYIKTDWEWGGIEGGLLVLNSDFTFREMWLSW